MKGKYIAAKEHWAAKRAGKLCRVNAPRTDYRPGNGRLPTSLCSTGIHPQEERADWRLNLHGLVEKPVTLDWTQFMALEQFADTSEFH